MKKTTAFPRFMRRAAALLLALALAAPTGLARAGERKLQTSTSLAEGLTYYNTITENASSRVESFALERSPYSAAYPILLQGSGAVYGASTIDTAVSYAQSLGYHVLGAVNADFFATSSGVPLGIVVEDGVYKSSAEDEAAMTITGGQVQLVDAPQVALTLTNLNNGTQIQPHHLNKRRSATGGLYLYNRDFSAVSTHTSDMGWYVRMRLVDAWGQPYLADTAQPGAVTDPAQTDPGQIDPMTGLPVTPAGLPVDPFAAAAQTAALPKLTVNCSLTLEVVELLQSDQAVSIGEDEYILSASDSSGYISAFQSFQTGDRVTLTASCADPALSAAQWAGGVGDVMVRNGAVTDSSGWAYVKTGRAPRTALGVKADGTLLVYTVDGRQSGYSMGLSQLDLAQEMQALGCQWAVNLDGGGSTAISVRVPGQEGAVLRSKPSDGVQRKCATYLLLVTDSAGDGLPARLALKEDHLVALTGSRLTLPEAAVLDQGLNVLPMAAYDLTLASGGLGTIDENGVYTAGAYTGTDTLLLSSPSLGVTGTAQIHIVDGLTGLTISREGQAVTALTARPGDTVQLEVAGDYWGRTALRDFSAVTWTVEDGVGTVDENGLFTMGGQSGTITARAGGQSRTIQVSVPYTHSDIPAGHWAYEAVEYCYYHGVVNGISPTEYGGENLVNRCDFVLMLYRAAGKPAVSAPCTFTDVAPGAYYADALAWAQSTGLASGGEDGTFRPEVPATREEAFAILRGAMPLLGKQCPDGDSAVLEQFADRDQIAEYARAAIATLVEQGIVNGKNTGIDPRGTLTRSEMAALLYRVLTYAGPADPVEPSDPADPAGPTDPAEPADPVTPADPALPDPSLYTLALDRTEASLAPAESVALTALLSPAYEGAEVVWTSSDPAAAPVTQQGVVTNIHPVEAETQVVITASWNGLSASCTVTCQPAVFVGTVTGAEGGLNVRSGPGTEYPSMGGLVNGDQVVVVSVTRSGWYHIHYLHKDGYAAEGYVRGDYLQLNRS